MLSVTIQQFGDTSVLLCDGRIVIGDGYLSLRQAVLSQNQASVLLLDVAQVDRMDGGGLGLLLELRSWARSQGIRFKLMNVTKNVDHLLELTKLQHVFESCSAPELLCLLHRVASSTSCHFEQPHSMQANCTSCDGQAA